MDVGQFIKELQSTDFYAECYCGGEFKLSKAILFDGTRIFPEEALKIQKQFMEELTIREKELVKSKKRVTDQTEIITKAVNVGKSLEKVLPTMRHFK